MNNRYEFESVESFYKSITVLHLAFVSGLIMFSGITWFLAPRHIYTLDFTEPFPIALILLLVTLVPIGHVIFQRRIAASREEADLQTKLNIYRQGFIIRCATLEGPALFSLICAFLTSIAIYYLFFLIPLVLFILARPTSLAALKQQINIAD